MASIDSAPFVDDGTLLATSALESPSEGDSLQHDRTFEPPAQEGADAFSNFETLANDPIEDLSDGPEGPDVNDPLSSMERQDLGLPAQSAIAEKIHTGGEAAAPLVREIDDPGYLPPDRANVLPEPDDDEPEYDETDVAAEAPACTQTDSVVGWLADLDVTPAPGPENKQARPKRSSRKTSPKTEGASKRAANRHARPKRSSRKTSPKTEGASKRVADRQARPKRSSRKTSPKTEDASKRAADREAKAEAQRAQAERVEAIVRDILTKQSRIGNNERANIPLWVAIGVDLIGLKREAGKGWLKRARELGYHPRQASRYQKLGETWGDKIGTIESDFLVKLPADLNVLERICQIPFEQLGDFLGAKENAEAIEGSDGKPRRWDRKRLAAEVDAWICAAPRPTRPPSPERIVQSFQRAVSKTALAFRQLGTEGVSSNDLRDRLHDILDKAIDQLEATSGPENIDSARISPE
jgi:hypothetical protein